MAFIAVFLPWLSIRHHSVYLKISLVLSRIAFEISIIIIFYDVGIYAAYFTIAEKYITAIRITVKDIDKLLIPLTIVVPIYFGFIIYLTILDNMHNILSKNEK